MYFRYRKKNNINLRTYYNYNKMTSQQQFYLIDTTNEQSKELIDTIIMKERIVNKNSKMQITTIPLRIPDPETGIEKLVYLKTAELRMPFGVSEHEGVRPKFSMLGSFSDIGTSEAQNNTLEFLRKFDERILELACKNKAWVGREESDPEAVIKAFHQPIVRKSKHKNDDGTDKYPPQVNIKLPTYQDGNFRCKVFEGKTKKLPPPPESISNNSRASCVLNLSTVYLVSGKFGVSMEAEQIKTTLVEKKANDVCLLSDSEDEN